MQSGGMFGDGSVLLESARITGRPGLRPTLALQGRVIARGYRPGAVMLVSNEVTAWDITGVYASTPVRRADSLRPQLREATHGGSRPDASGRDHHPA